jgi:hypothetical protein
MPNDGLQATGFREKMGCAGNDFDSFRPGQPGERKFIEFDHPVIGATYDQQRRRVDTLESIAGEVGAPAA